MSGSVPELPHLAEAFTPAQHAAHTTPPGVPYFTDMTGQKAAKLLNKVAVVGSNTGKPKPGAKGKSGKGGKGKQRMSKANARTITSIAKK